MKKIISIILVVIIGLNTIACKKKENPTVTAMNTQTTSNIYGLMFSHLIQEYNGTTYDVSDSTTYAYFYSSSGGNSLVLSNAGNVSLNGVSYKFNSGLYQDTTFVINLHQPNSIWFVSGNSNVPAFSYTYTPSYPQFTGDAMLPDSFSISSGFTVNLAGVMINYNGEVSIEITSSTFSFAKKIPVNQTNCTFSASDLSVIPPGSYWCQIYVVLNNSIIYTNNGRDYNIGNSLQHIKSNIKIKP